MGLTVLLGGTRSGKSRLAVELAADSKVQVVVIATGEPRDDEMAERILRHRAERSSEWETIEEPINLEQAIARIPDGACALVDCLTLWVSNLLERACSEAEIEERATAAARLAASRSGVTVAVSNEVGSGIVPPNAMARRYADILGRVNTIWVEASNRAALVIAGRILILAPAKSVVGGSHDG